MTPNDFCYTNKSIHLTIFFRDASCIRLTQRPLRLINMQRFQRLWNVQLNGHAFHIPPYQSSGAQTSSWKERGRRMVRGRGDDNFEETVFSVYNRAIAHTNLQ